jgi:polyphosphate kinase
MTRNTERRIEVACPVLNETIRERILGILKVQLAENCKAWKLGPDGEYRMSAYDGEQVNCQDLFMKEALAASGALEPAAHDQAKSRLGRFRTLVRQMMAKKDEHIEK